MERRKSTQKYESVLRENRKNKSSFQGIANEKDFYYPLLLLLHFCLFQLSPLFLFCSFFFNFFFFFFKNYFSEKMVRVRGGKKKIQRFIFFSIVDVISYNELIAGQVCKLTLNRRSRDVRPFDIFSCYSPNKSLLLHSLSRPE